MRNKKMINYLDDGKRRFTSEELDNLAESLISFDKLEKAKLRRERKRAKRLEDIRKAKEGARCT